MENQLSLVFMLPLKEIAMRKVAINLWNEPDVLASIEGFSPFFGNNSKAWSEAVDSNARDKMSELELPKPLKKQMLSIITPIGLQIKRWITFHDWGLLRPFSEENPEEFLVNDASILSKLCWTTTGKIDYLKSAKELLHCEKFDIVRRYQLACLCCLEDYIRVLWEELPAEIKGKFYNEADTSKLNWPYLHFCWPYILKGEQSKLDCIATKYGKYTSYHHQALDFAASHGNKAATEYFLRKLTPEEKDSFISRVVVEMLGMAKLVGFTDMTQSENVFDILCYLLSQINHEQRMKILKIHPCCVLLSFMDWPCQELFLKNADLIWDLLPAEHYGFLLRQMKAYFRNANYYYPEFFREFFTHSPISFRKKFVDRECQSGYFLRIFFNIQDTETVKVIFSNVDAADRVKLVSSYYILVRLYNCILRGKRHKVKVFLREATLCKEDMERLKQTFISFLPIYRGQIQENKRVLITFFHLLNEIYASAQRKRCLEDEIPNKAKRLCSD